MSSPQNSTGSRSASIGRIVLQPRPDTSKKGPSRLHAAADQWLLDWIFHRLESDNRQLRFAPLYPRVRERDDLSTTSEYNERMICDSQEPQRPTLEAFLTHHRIEATRHEHAPVMTVAESERLVPPLPGAKTKNLFLRDKKGARHFLVTVPYDLAVDLDALALQLGAGRLGFASADRLMKHLGVTPGSVSMLALVNDAANAVELVVDRRLWEAEAVHAHPLVNTATMVIAHGELERFLAATGHSPRVAQIPGRSR